MAEVALARLGHKVSDSRTIIPRVTIDTSSAPSALNNGHPLLASVRASMERGFGHGFSMVRVHDEPADRRRAHELHARAFTYRGDIWLGEGQPADDLSLMAHELAHVVQQTRESSRYDNVIDRLPNEKAGEPEEALPTNPAAARSIQFKGIATYAGTEVPATAGSGPFHTVRAGRYILGPNAIQCLNGEFAPLYFVAYHLDRNRNEWIVGPNSLDAFKAEAESRAQTAAGNASADGSEPVAIPLNRTHAAQVKKTGIEPHYMARSVPYTSKTSAANSIVAGGYELLPRSVHLAEGGDQVLYYVARNKRNGYDQWIIGPDSVTEFQNNADAYLAGAALAYLYGPPHSYEAESARFVWGSGRFGSAWGQAVRDPKFLVQALAPHVPVGRILQPLAIQVRGITAAAMLGASEVPALTLSAAPKAAIQIVEGSTAQAVSRQVSQPMVTAVTETAATEALPTAVARASTASSIVSGMNAQVVSGVKAAVVVAAPMLASRVDPDIDQAVDRSFVEHALTGRPAPQAPLRRVERSAAAVQARADFNSIRDTYAQALQVAAYGQVHHAIEVQVLSRYPGVYTPNEINQAVNMRGIPPELSRRTQLHNSKIREILDRHYRALDQEIARLGLRPGIPEYNALVRAWMNDAVAEIDYVLGQFFSEQRATLFLRK